MLRSVLVALDGSAYTEAVTTLALDWASRSGARLLGIGVLDEPSIRGAEPVPMGAGAYKLARDEARMADAHRRVLAFLGDFQARCGSAGVTVRVLEDVGDPAEQIVREAQRCDVAILGRETFLTLLGYEVIESPNNLNYSRGYLFSLAVPLTTTGGLVSYAFTDWLSAQAGVVLGWDRSNTDNSGPSGTGQIAVTPVTDLTTALNFIVGPEISGDENPIRWVVALTARYTGMKDWTFGVNFDYGWQANDVFLRSQGAGGQERRVVRAGGVRGVRLSGAAPGGRAGGVAP